ncbi:MAG TPA: hypothetical protein VMX97_00140, partial [Hyphomicrobiaceae bacterium]|nr:hypothetical protein [Hyphomicrobiaceae bacterium]
DALRAVLDKQVVATGPTVRAMRAARKQMVDAFLAEPFDKQRFSEANRHYMDSRTVLVRMRSDSYPEVVSLLTGGERRAFVKWRQSRRERWRRWRRHEPH